MFLGRILPSVACVGVGFLARVRAHVMLGGTGGGGGGGLGLVVGFACVAAVLVVWLLRLLQTVTAVATLLLLAATSYFPADAIYCYQCATAGLAFAASAIVTAATACWLPAWLAG